MSRTAQNGVVVLAALGAALAVVHTQTNWLQMHAAEKIERERCFGVARQGHNDCATPKHSCAMQSSADRDPDEWVMLPSGLCERIHGGRAETL
ncbi:MAG: DUF2282 domain-containing protein [Rickettsiales bacterium]